MEKILKNKEEINSIVKEAEHQGTYFIKGNHVVKTKTFNRYNLKDGKILITNHYSNELVNAFLYENENDEDYKKAFGETTWTIYRLPLLP